LNAIASLGIKVKDLYKISFEDFIRQHPEYKKLSKEVQQKRYELYDEERLSNINRCILKRQEIIKNTKKVKPIQKKIKIDGEESDEEDNANYDLFLNQNYKERKSEDNYILRKNYSGKNKKFLPTNKIIVTENSYIMNNSNGKQSQMTKEDIDSITCIKDEKNKLEKKNEKKDEQLMRYLKVELERAQKIRKVKDKLNEKDKKIQKFMKVKDKGMKRMENDRYKDHQDVYERQKIYEKMLSNYDQKIYLSKQQQLEQYRTLNLNKISSETSKKMEELNKQIEDYERKNQEYKEKITNLFDLKEKEEIDKKIKEADESYKLKQENLKTQINLQKEKIGLVLIENNSLLRGSTLKNNTIKDKDIEAKEIVAPAAITVSTFGVLTGVILGILEGVGFAACLEASTFIGCFFGGIGALVGAAVGAVGFGAHKAWKYFHKKEDFIKLTEKAKNRFMSEYEQFYLNAKNLLDEDKKKIIDSFCNSIEIYISKMDNILNEFEKN
jgi:hypothetical protein